MSDIMITRGYSDILYIIFWGTMWGFFESTLGYLLHLVSFGYSWIFWYPFACFCMANVYRKTRRLSSVLYVGLLCATIKMLNLFLPGRIDKVINPAISIVFEALALVIVALIVNHFCFVESKILYGKALAIIVMNTGWRTLFALYLFFLVPDWIRDISVINNADQLTSFFLTQNLITSTLIFIGYLFRNAIFRPIVVVENQISILLNVVPKRTVLFLQTGLAMLLLCTNIALQFLLK